MAQRTRTRRGWSTGLAFVAASALLALPGTSTAQDSTPRRFRISPLRAALVGAQTSDSDT